uniref:Shugoshin_C domain-containing protein n=1 Tax=Steinernema glaseri TaxID=37863 RepID=A0A1I8A4Z2_9BILA
MERRPSSQVVAPTSTTPVVMDPSDEEVFKPGSLEESAPPLPNSLSPSTGTCPATSDKAVVWPSPAMEPEEVRFIRTASRASLASRAHAYKQSTDSLSQTDRLVKRSSTKASTKPTDSSGTEKILCNRMLSGDSSAKLIPNKPKTKRASRRHSAPIRFREMNHPNTLKNDGLDKKKSAPMRRNKTVIYKANPDEINVENCEQLTDLDINMDDSKNFVSFDTLLRPKRFNRRKETLKRENDKNPVFLDVSDTTNDAELTPKATLEQASCSASNTLRDSNVPKEIPNDDHLFKQPVHVSRRFRSRQRKKIQSSTESEEWVQSAAAISRFEQANELATCYRPSVAACEASGIVSRRIAAIESDKPKVVKEV